MLLRQVANKQDRHVEENVRGIEPFLTRAFVTAISGHIQISNVSNLFAATSPRSLPHEGAILKALDSGVV